VCGLTAAKRALFSIEPLTSTEEHTHVVRWNAPRIRGRDRYTIHEVGAAAFACGRKELARRREAGSNTTTPADTRGGGQRGRLGWDFVDRDSNKERGLRQMNRRSLVTNRRRDKDNIAHTGISYELRSMHDVELM
jgi:hypothetical protein